MAEKARKYFQIVLDILKVLCYIQHMADTTKSIAVHGIPEDLWQAARIEAMKRGLTMRDFLVTLLVEATKPRKEFVKP